jgi:hypothetical protein
MVCVRSAWLVLGSQTILLEDPTRGYFCQSLELGSPEVREVISHIPDADGADDHTMFMGQRTVTAQITALAGAGARIDDVADNFAPYMVPHVRPVLHFVLDRPGAAERTLVLRAANYAWPIAGPYQRDIQLQWVAADPVVRDPTTHTVTALSGASSGPGRTYPLTFNRVYPAGGGSPSTATLSTPGDVPMRPLLRVYGPIVGPRLALALSTAAGLRNQAFNFAPSYTIDAGHWVDVDCLRRTVYRDSDPTQNVINQVDWSTSVWLYVTPLPDTATLSFAGSGASGVTQVQAIWQDGYLT